MNNIISLYKTNKNVIDILKKTKGLEYNLFCNGMTMNLSSLLSSTIYSTNNEFVIMVFPNAYKANNAYDTVTDIIGYENVNLYIIDDFISTEAIVISNELKQERLNTIKSIVQKTPKVIVTHIGAMLRPVMSLKRFKTGCKKLRKGDGVDMSELIKLLVNNGYERVHTTFTIGQFSVRGEVIDIFPSCMDRPIRINISFDEIESIKYYDFQTQLTSSDLIDEVSIFPMNEMVIDFDISELENKLLDIENNEYIEKDFVDIKDTIAYEKLNKYIEYIDKDYCTLVDYLHDEGLSYVTMYDKINDIQNAYESLIYEAHEYAISRTLLKKINLRFFETIEPFIDKNKKTIYLSDTKKAVSHLELMGIYEFGGYKVVDYENDLKNFNDDIKNETVKTFLTFKNQSRMELVKEMFNEAEISYTVLDDFFHIDNETINLVICPNAIGYGIVGFYKVITENEIFKKSKTNKTKYRSVSENTSIIGSKDDLHIGDYVVHYDYGIGKYLGIKTVELNNNINDYLQLQYENMELLIPMEKITELEKYLGSDGVVPKLTKIGTHDWEKRKEAVRSQLESIAKSLIELQVKRESLEGHKYQSDSEFQKLFEEDFEFEETEDQLKIVSEIKSEMEKGVLMDRLVCGDVGFGKTEIAMRIAFKTVYEGKQVAYMAPTTILTRQHYHSFKERFERYGIKVALLNRLVSPTVQTEIINGLRTGEINIVIGTHRLLNEEIKYNDLGLLVIDEEQRFGVTHKEKIKQMKSNVNVITLTATPIPRTLQMAVTGIRSLSLLETPPKDRYPIQTYVLEHSDSIVKEAIYRELARNGQVFYLHNKISDIEVVAKRIKRLVPEAKICIGHGKMNRDELEDVVSRFIDGEYNVLICTTIIETGIDIPNSNTLIVEDASRLGLAQMYQIRGRVGRTDRIAYAYFTYLPEKTLSSASEKRLSAIKEFTKVGSGYKIAVRDLAIRGAGDILGREQSGFINSIGIDMYMKLLNEAVNKAKGVEEKKKINYRIEVDKHVEREYVDDDTIIIYIHKEINSISSKKDKDSTIHELTDRFGKLSETVLTYIEERYLESQLRRIGVTKVEEMAGMIMIVIPQDFSQSLKGDKVITAGYELSEHFNFQYRDKQFIVLLNKKPGDKSWLYLMNSFLEKIID